MSEDTNGSGEQETASVEQPDSSLHNEKSGVDTKSSFIKSKKTKAKDSNKPWWYDFLSTVVVVVLITAIFKMFVGQIYEIPSGSMEPTMMGGDGTNDRVYVDKIKYRFSNLKVGDVIVFKAPSTWGDPYAGTRRSSNAAIHKLQDFLSLLGLAAPDEYDLTKRVIATGGQTISCKISEGGFKVDGKLIKEPYLDNDLDNTARAESDVCFGTEFGPVKIPANRFWVMGDNRINSADSRFHMQDEAMGTVPRANIIGKVQFVVYPVSRWKKIQ